MRGISTLLLAAGLATAPALAFADPSHGSQTESFEMMSMGKGRLGVLVLGITPELRKHYGVPGDRGVLVARVDAGSPAARAGLQAGDIITYAGGRTIDQASDLASAISGIGKDKSVNIEVVREHKTLSLSAKLTSDPVSFMDFDWFREMFRRFEQPMPRTLANST